MALWEINAKIQELMDQAVDEETGELDEAVFEELDKLELAREIKHENIACLIKNKRNFVEGLKAEKKIIADRQAKEERSIERLLSYLQMSLNGEKPESPKYQVRYTKTTKCEVYDQPSVIEWLDEHGFNDAIKVETSVSVTEVKKMLKDGLEVPGATLIEGVSMSIK